jgi:hypothetical protein
MPAVFHCPTDKLAAANVTSYVVAVGDGTYFPPHGTVKYKDVRDAPALTAMVGELSPSTIVWSKPEDLIFDHRFFRRGFTSTHDGGWQMLMGDGRVRFVPALISHNAYRAIMTIAGGEHITEDDL